MKSETAFGLQTFRQITPPVLVVLVFIVALFGAWLGVDFGRHWDEDVVLRPVYEAFDSGLWLNRSYIYPSVSFHLAFTAVIPEIIRYFLSPRPAGSNQIIDYRMRFKPATLNYLGSDHFKIIVRKIFIVFSLLAVFWIYLLVWVWRQNAWEALLAAALLGWSWEFSYHARWVVPDAPMLMFTVLTYLFLVLAWTRSHWQRWLKVATIAAAFVCGCKYHGGSLLLPVILSAGWLMRRAEPEAWGKKLFKFLLELILIFSVVYLFTTPGTIFEPEKFYAHVRFVFERYRTSHFGYTVHPGAEHYGRMAFYFAMAALSSCSWVSVVLFGFAGLGLYDLCRRESLGIAVSFLSFPVFYFLFMGTFPVMIVRNILLLIPFFAILAARGVTWFWQKAGKYGVTKPLLLGVVLMALIWNAYWIVYAGRSISRTTKKIAAQAASAYIERHPNKNFWLSHAAATDLAQILPTPRNITQKSAQADYVIFDSSEISAHQWLANRPNYFRHWFGPYDVNLNYYPSWPKSHLVVISAKEFDELSRRSLHRNGTRYVIGKS